MSEPVARLRIELEDITPRIWRRVDVPTGITLATLHEVIQAAMRWRYVHLYEFRVGKRVYGDPSPGMESTSRRVYEARGVRLSQLIDRGVDRFLYVYDFGDDWRHDIAVEAVRQGEAEIRYPVFVDGARRAPPEDVGGPSGFERFLDVVSDPSHHEHARMLRWYGGSFDPDDIHRRRTELDFAALAEFRRRALMGHRTRRRHEPH